MGQIEPLVCARRGEVKKKKVNCRVQGPSTTYNDSKLESERKSEGVKCREQRATRDGRAETTSGIYGQIK